MAIEPPVTSSIQEAGFWPGRWGVRPAGGRGGGQVIQEAGFWPGRRGVRPAGGRGGPGHPGGRVLARAQGGQACRGGRRGGQVSPGGGGHRGCPGEGGQACIRHCGRPAVHAEGAHVCACVNGSTRVCEGGEACVNVCACKLVCVHVRMEAVFRQQWNRCTHNQVRRKE